MGFSLAVIFAYGVGILVAFSLNAIYVFPDSDRPRHRQMRDFVLVNLAFFPVVWALSLGLKEVLLVIGWTFFTEAFAHGFAISVPMFATFLIYKFLIFRLEPKDDGH